MILAVDQATAILTAPGARFEMETRIIRGVETRSWKRAPPTLRHVLEASRGFGDRPYLVYEGERLSYAGHYAAAAQTARALVERFSVAKGDRVAIAMRNFPEWPIVFWGTVVAGAVAVPLNAWWSGEELAYGLAHSGARVLFADGERLERLAPYLAELPLEATVAVRADGPMAGGALSLEPVLAAVTASGLPDVAISPEDEATIFYTSGTTGRPKGAVGTHRNICTNPFNVAFARARTDVRHGRPPVEPGGAQRTTLLSVPFFHATGCHSTLVSTTIAGDRLVLMHKWDPERALELIEAEGVNGFGGVPGMVWQVLESPGLATRDLSSIDTVAYGGAPSAPELVRRIGAAFPGAEPRNGYGLTETSSVVSINVGEDYAARPDSIGLPVAVCDVRLVDADGAEVERGAIGELWVRGPNVVKGYWNDAAATDAAISDGWLRTGDLVRADDEGFLTIVDRAKDMLIRGGENVYCVEVENVLYDHADVMDAAVIGLPHHILGEEVGAVVQVRPGTAPTEDGLRAHVAAHLAAFKVPVRIDTRTAPLPRNANGKVLKERLKQELGV